MAHGSRLIAHLALCLIVAVCLLTGCREGGVASDARLLAIDSIVDTDSVAAWRQLQAIDSASLTTDADRHLYALLHQQLRYAQYVTLDTAVLRKTIDFYGRGDGTFDRSHYVRALILMGGSHEDALRYPEAMEWYLRALNEADTTDYRNLGQANFRIGLILSRNFARHLVMEPYFEKSYHYYNLTTDTSHTAVAASYLASTYRVTHHEKAHAALEEAARLCLACRDTFEYMNCRDNLARCLYEDSLPRQSLAVLKAALAAVPAKWLTNNFCYDAARAYATLGHPDSARLWLAKTAPAASPQERYFVFACRERIARAESDNAEAYRLAKVCSRLADSIASNKDVLALMRLEALDRDYAAQRERKMQNELSRRSQLWVCGVVAIVVTALAFVLVVKIRSRRRERAIYDEWRLSSVQYLNEIEAKEALLTEQRTQHEQQISRLEAELQRADNASKSVGQKGALQARIARLKGQIRFQNKFISDYLLSLKELVRVSEVTSPKVFRREFDATVSRLAGNNDFWRELDIYIDNCYDGLLSRLREDYAALNESEVRVIELMLCDFGYIETSVLMGLTRNSVTKMRTRITRKMNLSCSLNEFIEQCQSMAD